MVTAASDQRHDVIRRQLPSLAAVRTARRVGRHESDPLGARVASLCSALPGSALTFDQGTSSAAIIGGPELPQPFCVGLPVCLVTFAQRRSIAFSPTGIHRTLPLGIALPPLAGRSTSALRVLPISASDGELATFGIGSPPASSCLPGLLAVQCPALRPKLSTPSSLALSRGARDLIPSLRQEFDSADDASHRSPARTTGRGTSPG